MTAPITPISHTSANEVIALTERWLEKAVIGLNLCPFAKAVHVKKQIRYTVSTAQTVHDLESDLNAELELLSASKPDDIETTLLIHPHVLNDFLDYNDFLDTADGILEQLDLTGQIQIASFHPDYQFAGTDADDITNYTNRSPYPILHLLREESIERAVEAFPDAEDIFEKNIATMERIGIDGWKKLNIENPGAGTSLIEDRKKDT